jgi:type 1 glutamine amidotransferase
MEYSNMKSLKIISLTAVLTVLIAAFISCKKGDADVKAAPVNVLIYSKTKAYRHECIEPGSKALQSYFEKYGIASTLTEDSSLFTPGKLKDYDVVMFFQTTGNVLDSAQQGAFENYIKSGKGFVGVHAASDTEYDWPWYGKLVGAYYSSHPDIQPAALIKVDTAHISCKHLPDRWTRTDEWYNFKQAPADVNILLKIDEATYTGGEMGGDHPMSWYHTLDGGRAFYTALGHTVECYRDTLFLEHVRQGVIWASKK